LNILVKRAVPLLQIAALVLYLVEERGEPVRDCPSELTPFNLGNDKCHVVACRYHPGSHFSELFEGQSEPVQSMMSEMWQRMF
jgi:hypothetical protein